MRNNYSQELYDCLPPDVKHPSHSDFELIQEIADSRRGRQRELSSLLAKLEHSALVFSETHRRQPTNFSVRDSIARLKVPFAPVPDFTDPELMDRHTERVLLVSDIIKTSSLPARVEDGGLKSQRRVEEKIQRKLQKMTRCLDSESFIYLQDASRLRVVADTFEVLDQLYGRVHDALRSNLFLQVGFTNRYASDQVTYAESWRGINSSWVLETPRDSHPADRIATEVQFVTRRVCALMGINHAFDVSKVCRYPTPQHRAWVHRGLSKASILDLEEFLRGKKDAGLKF